MGIIVFIIFFGVFILLFVLKSRYLDIVKEVLDDPLFAQMYLELQSDQELVFNEVGYCDGKTRLQDCSDEEMEALFPMLYDRKFFNVGFLLERLADCSGMDIDPASKYFFLGNL